MQRAKETMKSATAKSTARKPLADVSNGGNPLRIIKKKSAAAVDGHEGALDHLLLVRSDLSNLFNEIDELVVQALNLKVTSKMGGRDIDSFRQVLSNMHSSLKPWVSKLQTAFLANEDSDQSKDTVPELDMVSLSPLVKWPAGASTIEGRGRQLFQLTPLPKPKTLSSKPISVAKIGKSEHVPLLKNSTPEVSPPKSHSSVFNPTSAHDNRDMNKSSQENSVDDSDNLSFGENSANLASRYQELFGLPPPMTRDLAIQGKGFDEALDWFLSPPKTCKLMEPSYEKPHKVPDNAGFLATPMETGFESTVRRGKQAGESTLKRELWVRFEAATCMTTGVQGGGASAFPKTSRKGFLDMLEEVSTETEDSESSVAR